MGISGLQTLKNGQFYACHQDEQGSTIYITGRDGAVENCYAYDAFGNSLKKKEGIQNRIQYTGQQYDQETGQYYLRARYYNPAVGRFTQEDTYRGDGLNLYVYCKNNPVLYYDPSGHIQAVNPSNELETTNTFNTRNDSLSTFDPSIEDGNYSSLRDLMSPEEAARYDEYWLDAAERISNEAIDNQIAYIESGGITKSGGGKFKPAKISATVDLNNGNVYIGYNGTNKFNPSKMEIHPDLQERINFTENLARNTVGNEYAYKSSFEVWNVDNCAEVYSVNQALHNGASMDNIFINTKVFDTRLYAPPCRNCRITFDGAYFPKIG